VHGGEYRQEHPISGVWNTKSGLRNSVKMLGIPSFIRHYTNTTAKKGGVQA